MVRSPRPLQEKLTLFWHDHFATTDQDTPMMLAQNRTLRRHALGSFPMLLREVTTDPAMLLFLSLAELDRRGAERELRARADGAVHARRAATASATSARRRAR